MPRPEPGPRDVLVRVRACGICGSDVHGYDGSSGRRIPPLIMGHEAAGVVDEVGADVGGLQARRPRDVRFDDPLRRVRVLPRRAGEPVRPAPGGRRLAGRVPPATAPSPNSWWCRERIVCRVPDPVPFEHAAMVEPVSVAVHAVRRAKIAAGDKAVVVGCGMIGLLTIQAAKAAGCASVIAVDLDEGPARAGGPARRRRDARRPGTTCRARIAALTGGPRRGRGVRGRRCGRADRDGRAQPAEGRHAGADRQRHAEGRGRPASGRDARAARSSAPAPRAASTRRARAPGLRRGARSTA